MGGRAALLALLIFAAVLSVFASVAPPPAPKTTRASELLSSPGGHGNARPSSAVFPVYGNVYPNGVYYAVVGVGDPPKPYFLDVDTGSDLTWLLCDAPCVDCPKAPHPWYGPRKEKLIPRQDPLCVAVQSIAPPKKPPGNSTQCDYDIHYADQGSSVGVLIADAFTLRLTNTSVVRPSLAFGCGYNPHFPHVEDPWLTDGMLGLGSGKAGVLSQLSGLKVTKNVMGHCLGTSASLQAVAGFVFFGDDVFPANRMTWAPMSRVSSKNYYSVGRAGLYFGTQSLGVRMMDVVLDSGTPYNYFESQPYKALLTAVRNDLSTKPLMEVKDPELPVCWKGQKPFKTVNDVKPYFKPLALNLENGNGASFLLPPENYLIVTKNGNACLGILDGSEMGLNNLNVIGDVSMQNLLVAYDNEQRRIGWIRADCSKIPKS